MPTIRKRVAEGVYQSSKSTVAAKVQVGSGEHALVEEKPFPIGTPNKEIQAWRDAKRVELRKLVPVIARGTIESEIPTYLERAAKRPASLPAKKSEMNAWKDQIGTFRRHQVKPAQIDAAIRAWLAAGVSKKTIVNRCRTLHHFYVTMADDKRTPTPLDNVDVPAPPKRQPKHVPATLVIRTEKRLRAAIEDARALAKRNHKLQPYVRHAERTRARFMVYATTGIRPSQLKRLRQAHVDVRRRVVDIAAGKGGEPILQAMNTEQLAAWRAFVAADAWGSYDDTKFRRRLRAAGWPKGLRPYELKHAVGITLAEQDADRHDIKDWYGHADVKTTEIYTGRVMTRVRRTAAKLDHRFGWAAKPSHADVPRKAGTTGQKSAESGAKRDGKKTA